MAQAENRSSVRLTLELWHPDCWAIEATDRTDGGVLAHAIYNSPTVDETGPRTVRGVFTAFAETKDGLEDLLDAIRDSDHSGSLSELQQRFGRERSSPGNVVREFFLEYDPDDMICPTLLENGFVHSAPVRIQNGSEEWNVCYVGDRSRIEQSLDDVCEQTGADVSVTSISTSGSADSSSRNERLDSLTPTQREVFEHARETGYYEWPRQTTTRELAADLDVSKSTLLEHLRKAESKLLDP
ncbi:helix-turn-helix domain-containing protein [Natrarchaeobius chitinivorans]|uniref:Transcriptional regulator n=1 Tax=Natrarchaeobius chitinivorans TaxID=1679083 RepID=A0A3N6N5P8_NATCH|nr:helix-turn-helix domain-containing protein [Natrarchaeobius chitinivorans]RQG93622.1 transcriptional regulator [Natrarchaeobius chitinivorans]